MQINENGRTDAIVKFLDTGAATPAPVLVESFAVRPGACLSVEAFVTARATDDSYADGLHVVGFMHRHTSGDATDVFAGAGYTIGGFPVGGGVTDNHPTVLIGNDGTGDLNECRVQVQTPAEAEWAYTLRLIVREVGLA